MKKIAIQGINGSFHHTALSILFKNKDYYLFECKTFKNLVFSLLKNKVDMGIMAIENSIVGDIISNYILIYKYNLKIISEIYIPIEHYLMALPGEKIEKIKKIISHPMAILQCTNFLQKQPKIEISDYYDTAGAAKYIYLNQIKGIAAIAPKISAKIYKLEIIESNIQNFIKNFTRFLVITTIKKQIFSEKKINKASISLKLLHVKNSIFTIIKVISDLQINITKIQSIPISEKPWQYIFFIDLEFSNINSYIEMKNIIFKSKKLIELRIIGEYKNREKNENYTGTLD